MNLTIKIQSRNHNSAGDQSCASNAAQFTADGHANILMKGLISTGVILKSVLNKELNRLDQKLLSHVALFSLPNRDKPVLISDAAMNIDPDAETKIKIIENAAAVARKLNIEKPKVALLSAVEKVNEKIASTVTNDTIVKSHKFDHAIVDGQCNMIWPCPKRLLRLNNTNHQSQVTRYTDYAAY